MSSAIPSAVHESTGSRPSSGSRIWGALLGDWASTTERICQWRELPPRARVALLNQIGAENDTMYTVLRHEIEVCVDPHGDVVGS